MDTSVYGAMIHFSQFWKVRYPLIYIQGNNGNVLGDSAAASRYTECKLSQVGDLMLEGINDGAVAMKENYDGTQMEPTVLPSKFPNILCNGSLGIAVGLSASLVPHNYNNVADAIEAYIKNNLITTAEISKIIVGPDFPEGGLILNGEDLENIYDTGNGTIKLRGEYKIEKSGQKTIIVFTSIPYLVDIEPGIIAPLKKLVIEEQCAYFDDIINNTDDKKIEIKIILTKNTNVDEALAVLFSKTNLEKTIKVNNTVLVGGEPKVLGLTGLIHNWLLHRYNCINNITKNKLDATNHKLTITIGLQKCMSDIDKVISLIRAADSRDAAKIALCKNFELTEEQVNAVLDMKLSRLSKLDIQDLKDTQTKLENEVKDYKDIISSDVRKNNIITTELEDMRKICGDDRRTHIISAETIKHDLSNLIEKNYNVYNNSIVAGELELNAIDFVKARNISEIYGYTADGQLIPGISVKDIIGATVRNADYLISITKKGYIKKTSVDEYNLVRTNKICRLKPDDEILKCGFASDNDYIVALLNSGNIVKMLIKDLNCSGKNTLGSVAADTLISAQIVNNDDILIFINKDGQAKKTSVKDFEDNSRTSKGQKINNGVIFMTAVRDRDQFILKTKNKNQWISINKLALKSKSAVGASITTKQILTII